MFTKITPAILFSFWLYLIVPEGVLAQSPHLSPIPADVDVTATIGVPTATPTATPTSTSTPTTTSTPITSPTASPTPIIYPTGEVVFSGWAFPNAIVTITGIAVSESTVADQSGYFEFSNLTLPTPLSYLAGFFYPEITIIAQDQDGRTTYPVKIPPLPLSVGGKPVGPILLPPTLSVNPGRTIEESLAFASGYTLPNTEVIVFLAKRGFEFGFFTPNILTYFLPTYSVTSNENGYFEFSLPTKGINHWNLFVATKYQESYSPKSNTLKFSVWPKSYIVIDIFKDITKTFKPTLLTLTIMAEILILLVLVVVNVRQDQRYHLKMKLRKDIKRIQTNYVELQKKYEQLIAEKKSKKI